MQALKNATTDQLVQELISRGEVKIVELGLYKPYKLMARYGAPEIDGFTHAILLDGACSKPDNSTTQNEKRP